MNIFKNIYRRFFPMTVKSAVASLDQAAKDLEDAFELHLSQIEVHAYAAEASKALADLHADAARKAERIRNKLNEFLS